ncbi:hypothetical protein AU106_gp189 [Sinorhizobium phage phiM9]|uniref:Uncharacterized protein n=1 Tax=Sinorhizobium phage phiM9 TaxID=1636182 RepID=A0A0F6R613_9CAUD|nr:hypothetical protein AU106_gp189 [Sinorhizobium phage phiM9]AKE44820.1 hypothetical protein Sm_phiM9_193 [Sinorhizobium phage phiM9]
MTKIEILAADGLAMKLEIITSLPRLGPDNKLLIANFCYVQQRKGVSVNIEVSGKHSVEIEKQICDGLIYWMNLFERDFNPVLQGDLSCL